MRAFKLFVTTVVLWGASFAQAGITCEPAVAAKAFYYDDPCEGITDAAETCFEELNLELAKVEEGKASEAEVETLASSYQGAIDRLRDEYTVELGKVGGACLDHGGEIEVWIREMGIDLKTLEKHRPR